MNTYISQAVTFLIIFISSSACTQLGKDRDLTDVTDGDKPIISEKHLRGPRPAVVTRKDNAGKVIYISLYAPRKPSDKAPKFEPKEELLKFIGKYYDKYQLKNATDHLKFELVTNKDDIKKSFSGKDKPFYHRIPVSIAKWDQSFLDIPVYGGKIVASFANNKISSVTGTLYSADNFENQFGDQIRKSNFQSPQKVEELVRQHLAALLNVKKESILLNSRLVIDIHNNRMAYVVKSNTHRVLVDANQSEIYRTDRTFAGWAARNEVPIRAFDLPNNRAHFIINLDKRTFCDGRADVKASQDSNQCTFRTTYGSQQSTDQQTSIFPYPTTFRYETQGLLVGNGLCEEGIPLCVENSGLISENNVSFATQNIHYRMSTAARYATEDWKMYLFADNHRKPEKRAPMKVYLTNLSPAYENSPEGGQYIRYSDGSVRIEIDSATTGAYTSNGWTGRFVPLHEYGHYIHDMYGYWPANSECERDAVKEGFADAMAVSFAARHDPTPVTDATFTSLIATPNINYRAWLIAPSSESDLTKVYGTCLINRVDSYSHGLAIPQVVYKLLNNRLCTTFNDSGCVPEVVLQNSLSCMECHDKAKDTDTLYLNLSREIVRDSLTEAMTTIDTSTATVESTLQIMQDYIEDHYGYLIVDEMDRDRIRRVFDQHRKDRCLFCHGN